MNMILAAFAYLIVFAFVSTATAQNEWVAFSPDGGNFTVMLPGTPKTEVKQETSTLGPYTIHGSTLNAGGVFYLVVYVDYAPTLRLDVQGEINANRDNFLKGVKGSTLINEKKITLGSHPGLEFTADIGTDRHVVSRIYVVGQRPYQLVAVVSKGADLTNANKFLSSFKLLK
jgi:hypothetical protein